ncbi:unnamed protein product, partial [Sphacelaria rigidula]
TIYCTGGYTLTQADVDVVSITNLATVIALPPVAGGADTISSQDFDLVQWTIHPALSLDASASLVSATAVLHAGDSVIFSFTVRNTGTTSLTE